MGFDVANENWVLNSVNVSWAFNIVNENWVLMLPMRIPLIKLFCHGLESWASQILPSIRILGL